MQVVCGKCHRSLEYSGQCPSFCAYCGQALGESTLKTPSASDPDAITQAPAAAANLQQAPAAVGGYRIGRELGSGGMGAVYEAEEIATSRRVALKLIKPEYAASADAVERFRQEGRIASRLVHPRCVFVLAVDEEAGRPYIVMELMTGKTLKELVGEQGALPPEQAIALILDVIDGLQAAHRLEVIHRDVKPSNCFLEADGRVKVGDFGLAKSLVQDGHLTKTGAFVGTPHFASPEQIRTEPIDVRTDVYSVAATLYFLLTAKPPFHGTNTSATLARIVTDPPPPLRSLRPELSPALERVVLRGLERDRDRRYPDLDAFRQALLGLVPEPLTASALLWRGAAFVLDLLVVTLTIGLGVAAALGAIFPRAATGPVTVLAGSVNLLLLAVYFWITECALGASVGKLLVGLRACTIRSIDPPGWATGAARSMLFVAVVFPAGPLVPLLDDRILRELVGDACLVIGVALIASTMRRRNGYRGLHEILTGTRVVQPIRPRETVPASGGWLLSFLHGRRQAPMQTGPLPQRIGGFAIRGALKWTATDKVLLGEDASLGRRVFIWLRPTSAPVLDKARRDVGRRTRLRWLGCGTQGDLQWDAILAPLGSPLSDFIHGAGAFAWREARHLMEELAGELAAALADDTLPATLTTAQVWVQEDGRAQLADLPLTATPPDEDADGAPPQRAIGLLARTVVLAMEGQPRSAGGATASLQATVPASARAICDRLLAIGGGYDTVEQFLAALQQTADR
jgi:hypothetical protein